ncbi:AbgT family transporter [uncultured Algimonas sp.]|uniref:AbgT family transporter n=1 Tax=uncultured Algimonas sp. TaxID=1547920 RepID=UPI00260F86E5|nr:AbgT family transporter [uncultured Algimonas sp.]
MTDTTIAATSEQKGILAWIERTGNKLPDPVFLFFYFIIALVIVSILCAWLGVGATLDEQVLSGMPDSQKARFGIGPDGIITAMSLLSADNIQRLWVEMPKTFTHFHPLGYVLVVMLGAGVAERSGLFASAMRSAVRGAPLFLLTPVVALVAMVGNHAADAAYVVLIPLAGVLFASAGRHPLAGIAAAFAGVSGGFSANLFPGQLDALLYGITEEAAEILNASYDANIAGNWWFIAVLMFIYLPIIWYVTDHIVEPRLGKWKPSEGADTDSYADEDAPLTPAQKKGLRRAGLAVLAVLILWGVMTFGPGTPLWIDGPGTEGLEWYQRAGPLFQSLVGGFLVLFLAAGWAYGAAAGTIRTHKDLVAMMAEAMKDMGYYLVLSFAAAHFVAMFAWSNLGLISAVHGANGIEASGLPLPILLGMIVLFSAIINLFVGSASAKWALLAPVMVPMLMLLGVSPDGATAVYRVGDSATNIITPLMVYFPLILVFAQRWQKSFGLGSLTAIMIPYSIFMLISGILLVVGWTFLGFDLGPGAPMSYTLPGAG